MHGTEHEYLRLEARDAPRREVDYGDHEPALELRPGVVGDLRGRSLQPELGAEVDLELPGRFARLREVVHADDPPHAHVDPLEVLDRRHRAGSLERAPGSGRTSRRGEAGPARPRPAPAGARRAHCAPRPAASWARSAEPRATPRPLAEVAPPRSRRPAPPRPGPAGSSWSCPRPPPSPRGPPRGSRPAPRAPWAP